MKLITKAIEKQLPPLYATEDVPMNEKVLILKLFTPWAGWTWYGVEWDQKDTFFGLVENQHGLEWGYFSLPELRTLRGPGGLAVERDRWWRPTRAGEAFPAMEPVADDVLHDEPVTL